MSIDTPNFYFDFISDHGQKDSAQLLAIAIAYEEMAVYVRDLSPDELAAGLDQDGILPAIEDHGYARLGITFAVNAIRTLGLANLIWAGANVPGDYETNEAKLAAVVGFRDEMQNMLDTLYIYKECPAVQEMSNAAVSMLNEALSQ